jgi:hypothetical protein
VITVDHNEVKGNCLSCHNGIRSRGKTTTHILTANACEACHDTTQWIPALFVDHAHTIGVCNACHNQYIASGISADHIAIDKKQCDACHSTIAWNITSNEQKLIQK